MTNHLVAALLAAETSTLRGPEASFSLGYTVPENLDHSLNRDRGTDAPMPLGDKNAFNELLQPHLSLMQYRVRSILQNDADVQDVVQEAMLCAFTKLHQLRAARFFRAWLMQIAVNCARMKLRRESAGHGAESLDEIFGDDGVSSPPRQIVDLRHSPSVYFERKEIYETLKRALERLPLIYREGL